MQPKCKHTRSKETIPFQSVSVPQKWGLEVHSWIFVTVGLRRQERPSTLQGPQMTQWTYMPCIELGVVSMLIYAALKWFMDLVNHKFIAYWNDGWRRWGWKYALMLRAVRTEPHTRTQSIVAVNKTSAASSHYASLMSNSWFFLACLSICRKKSDTGDESIVFSCRFWSSCFLFWHGVSREAVHTDLMFIIMQVTTDNKVMKILSVSGVFAYLQLSCVCVHVYCFVFLPSSEMQQPSKSQFKVLLSLITLLHPHTLAWYEQILPQHTHVVQIPAGNRDQNVRVIIIMGCDYTTVCLVALRAPKRCLHIMLD